MQPPSPRRLLFLAAALLLAALPRALRADVPSIGPSGPVGDPPAPVAATGSGGASAASATLSPSISDPVRAGMILHIIATARDGGSFPFPKDGVVWQNRDNQLPAQPNGFYREYTILPPAGSTSHIKVGDQEFDIAAPQGTRGVERLIIGGGQLYYYTPDHYATFIPLTLQP